MKLAVLKERQKDEKRVAATPDTIKKYVAMGITVSVEKGAGTASGIADSDFRDAGATIGSTLETTLKDATTILCVNAPEEEQRTQLPSGSLLVGLLNPHQSTDLINQCGKRKIDALAMELIPRISRAQSMDALSSQSNLAGYRAVIEGASAMGKLFPLMMTAAGTVPPAKVLIIGAGVAGLQAIATAKRLGAVVSAFDVRPAVKEQVESLGGTFIEVEADEDAETEGGYAKEMSDDYKKRQQAKLEEEIAKQDLVITTALIQGKPAPELISEAMVKSMKAGAVIVDLAAPAGGNCAVTKPGKATTKHEVTVLGYTDIVSRVAADASRLYARNLLSLMQLLYDEETKRCILDVEDDIVAGALITKDGVVIHPAFARNAKQKEQAA